MKAILTVTLENAKYADGDSTLDALAWLLREAADKLDDGETSFSLINQFGQLVGKMKVNKEAA